MKNYLLLLISLFVIQTKGFSETVQNSLEIKQVSDIVVMVEPGVCETTINYPKIEVNKTDIKLQLISGKGQNGKFPLGTTMETWKATDGSGNESVMSFNVNVLTYNAQPTVNPIENQVIKKDTGSFEIVVSGISCGMDCCEQKIKGVLVSPIDKSILNARVEYKPGDEIAKIILTPLKAGKTKVTFLVSDNGGTENNGIDVTTRIFDVEVVEPKSKYNVSEDSPGLKLKIYPNPVRDFVKFDINRFNSPARISVYSVSGKQITNRYFRPGDNVQLDLREYNPGIYLVHFEMNYQVVVKKLVLDR